LHTGWAREVLAFGGTNSPSIKCGYGHVTFLYFSK